MPLGTGLVSRNQNEQGIGHGSWLSFGVRWYRGRDQCALAVVVPCFMVSGLRWHQVEIGFVLVCVGYVVFCGIGLRSGLLRCALVSGLFCAVVLAVVVPCFVVLWVFSFFLFFFFCCGLVVVVVAVAVAVIVMVE